MAENDKGLRRGWHYDKINSRMEAWVDQLEFLRVSSTTVTLLAAGTAEAVLSASAFYPATSDGNALGTGTYMWSDLFLADGAVINFNNGTELITHSTNLLTITGSGLTMGATGAPSGDFILWATTTGAKVWLDVDGDTDGAFYFGANDYGIDVGFYGKTITNSMVWDAGSNVLVFTAAGITMGTASTFILPVKASGSTTTGDIWYDTSDAYIHFYSVTYGEKVVNCT